MLLKWILSSLAILTMWTGVSASLDTRNILHGNVIANLTTGYADQPMIMKRDDNAWIVSVTHNPSQEGAAGEAVYTAISKDKGVSWTQAKPACSTCGDEQYAYSTILKSKVVSDRFYILYVRNFQNITKMPDGTPLPREDMMGGFFMRVSDDGGETWSNETYRIHVNVTSIDKMNQWNGTVQLMWLVDKGFQRGDAAYVAFTKIGHYAVDPPTSGWLIYSPNIGSALSPTDIVWRILPDDDEGIRSYTDADLEGGCGLNGQGTGACISSESHVLPLDGDAKHLYVVFRTDAGYMGAARSDNGGLSFRTPSSKSNGSWAIHYAEPGSPAEQLVRPLKQPRGPQTPALLPDANMTSDRADMLMLYYNNGHVGEGASIGVWIDRNPYWLVPGWIVNDGSAGLSVEWGEPEVGLYVPGVHNGVGGRGCGYPDFVIERNENSSSRVDVYLTETQKTTARVHKVDDSLLYYLINQKSISSVPSGYKFETDSRFKGIVQDLPLFSSLQGPSTLRSDGLSTTSNGIALTMWFDGLGNASSTIFDTTSLSSDGSGLSLLVDSDALGRRSLLLRMVDVPRNQSVTAVVDAQCAEWLYTPAEDDDARFVAFSVDSGSRAITIVVNGVFCDGGPQSWSIHPQNDEDREAFQGWAFLPSALVDINGGGLDPNATTIRGVLDSSFEGSVTSLRIYPRYLLTTEMIGAWRSGR